MLAITLAALVMRLIGAQESPAGDELYLLEIIHGRSFSSMLHAVVNQEKTPPVGFVLSWLSAKLGNDQTWMRAPSVIAGTALVPVAALLARRAFSAAAGLAAAALVTVSPFLLFYGIESRSYALTALLTTASALVLLAACQRGGWKRWLGWALLIAAAILTHYTAIFVIFVEIIWALWTQPRSRRRLIAACGGALLIVAAWIPSFITQFSHAGDEARRIALSAPLSIDTLTGISGRALIGHPLGVANGTQSLSEIPGMLGLLLIVAGVGTAAGLSLLEVLRRRSSGEAIARPSATTGLLIGLALAAPVGLLLASLQPDRSLLLSRNLITSVPPLLILVAALLTRIPAPASLAATALTVAGLGIGSVHELSSSGRPDLRSAAKAIEQRWRPGDLILEAMYFSGPPLDRDLAIQLNPVTEESLLLTRTSGLRPFARPIKVGSSIFTVTAAVGYSTGVLEAPKQLKGRYQLIWSERWNGYVPVFAGQWQRIK